MINLLDSRAALPLYAQLQEAIQAEIAESGLRAGDKLPTESELEERYGVSRTTIRQALQGLVNDGVIERRQGKGTFVAGPRISHVPLLTSFTENMRGQGYEPSRRVIESATKQADEHLSDVLKLGPAQRGCRYLRRLLLADGRVVGISVTWLPVHVLGEHDELFEPSTLEQGSLYDLLQRPPFDLVLHSGVETVTPGVATSDDATYLECEVGDPILVVDRVSLDDRSRPVEATQMRFHGTRYQYRVEVARPVR